MTSDHAGYDAMPVMQEARLRSFLALCLLGSPTLAARETLTRALAGGDCVVREHGRERGRLWADLQAGESAYHVVCDLAGRRVEAIERRDVVPAL